MSFYPRRILPHLVNVAMRQEPLRPGGALLFLEHGRAPEPGAARWQDRLDPLRRRVARGCHLNPPFVGSIAGAGFHIEALANARLPGPRLFTYLHEGCARPR